MGKLSDLHVERQQTQEYCEGYEAAEKSECPYKANSKEEALWMEGFWDKTNYEMGQ